MTRLQQTRLHRQVGLAGLRLQDWAYNPWRRFSLQLIALFLAYFIGSAVAMITGALAFLDPLAALVCILPMEVSIRTRRHLLQRQGDRLWLQLIDASRVGLLYGLLQEGFKLL